VAGTEDTTRREKLRALHEAEALAIDLAARLRRARHELRELERAKSLSEASGRARSRREPDTIPMHLTSIERDVERRIDDTLRELRRAERERDEWHDRARRANERLARLHRALARLAGA